MRGSVVASAVGGAMIVLFASPTRVRASVPLETRIAASIAATCPSATAVSERLDAYLVDSSVDGAVTAALDVAPEASGGFTVAISLRRGELTSDRAIVGMSCVEVLEAAVLVIAIALDPDVLDRAPPTEASLVAPTAVTEPIAVTEPTTPTVTVIEPSAPITPIELSPREVLSDPTPEPGAEELASPLHPRSVEPERSEPALLARAHASMTVAVVPAPSFGALVDVGVRLSWLELTLGLMWASETVSERAPGRGGVFALYVGTLRIGAALSVDVLEVVPQVRLGAGAMTARGIGVDRPRAAVSEWFDVAVGLELRVRWSLGALTLGISALGELSVPLIRPRFVLNDDEDVFTPEIVGATFGLGAVVSWGPISGDGGRAPSAL